MPSRKAAFECFASNAQDVITTLSGSAISGV
jgi:hypothetical protein